MELWGTGRTRRCGLLAVFGCAGLIVAASLATSMNSAAAEPAQEAAQSAAARPVGTVKSISGKTIILTTDAKVDVTIQVQDGARLLRITPDQKDLKNAAPLDLKDLQTGDRILVRGKLADDGKTVLAVSVIAMKQADIATKQAHDREEWQRHGIGGLVSAIDAANGTITVSTNAQGPAKNVMVLFSQKTILRRYASDSVKFDDAKPAPMDQIKPGDQLRARGTRSADGTELNADEIVSGTFHNIAGTINAIDTAAGTITVMDLLSKKPITVKITSDTQLRKLQPQMAQMIAMRLKGSSPDTSAGANGSATPTPKPADAPAGGRPAGGGSGGAGGSGGPGGARGGDLQQVLSRIPAATLADLQKGDAVMIVTTEGSQQNAATAITLLAGVEPLLQASPAGGGSSILTPWSLSSAPAGDAAP